MATVVKFFDEGTYKWRLKKEQKSLSGHLYMKNFKAIPEEDRLTAEKSAERLEKYGYIEYKVRLMVVRTTKSFRHIWS